MHKEQQDRSRFCESMGRAKDFQTSLVPVLLILLLSASSGFAQNVTFNYFSTPTIVASTGQSEVLGQLALATNASCGTSVDALCVSGAGTIEITYSSMIIDNTPATGIEICESLSGVLTCNAPG